MRGSSARRYRTAWRLGALVPALLLAGCAGARITGLTAIGPKATAPQIIVVKVTTAVSADPALGAVASRLENRLVGDMRKLGLPATLSAIPETLSATHLTLRVIDYRRGDEVARMLIGFGAGKSAMTVTATLTAPRGSGFALDARAHSGAKPGLIMPGGVAAATGEVVHLAIVGAARVATSLHDGAGGDVRRISRLISRRVAEYYRPGG